MKTKVAIVRGKFLNKYELQFYEPLTKNYDLTGFGSLTCGHDRFSFPVHKLFSPVDLPDFPCKMPILNRLLIDANYLVGLKPYLSGFDIAHSAETYYYYTIQCLNAKKQGLVKKVVVSVFENIPFAGEGIWGRTKFKQRVFQEADQIIAVSEKTKDALLTEGCQKSKITIINQHIDTSKFKPGRKRKDPKEIMVLFTGRLEYYKGVFDFIKAAAHLLREKSLKKYQLHFLLVGKGKDEQKLINLENKLGIRQYFTHKNLSYEQMPAVYRQADIFIAPSKTTEHWQEQFSTVLLEAKASALPIISTNTGGIRENVGKAGILVPEGNHYLIFRQAKRLIESPKLRQSLGSLARSDALARFTIYKGADKISQVYQKVLNFNK